MAGQGGLHTGVAGRTLVVRADATAQIGAGHVLRCIALAQTWSNMGGLVHFVGCEYPSAVRARIADEKFVINDGVTSPATIDDAELTKSVAYNNGAVCIVIDGYQFDENYHRMLNDVGSVTLCLDDYGHLSRYTCDIILNPTPGINETIYANRSHNTQLLLGPQFALLRREFLTKRHEKLRGGNGSNRILVTLGAADDANATAVVINALRQIKSVPFEARIVIGGVNRHARVLWEMTQDDDRFQIDVDLKNMSSVYAWADFAITAGGSTNWEMCYFGIPRVIIVTAPNQRPNAVALETAGVAKNLGTLELLNESIIRDAVVDRLLDCDWMTAAGKASVQLVDGHGSQRVIQAIQSTSTFRTTSAF